MIFKETSHYLGATRLSKEVTSQQSAIVEIKAIFLDKLCNAEVLLTFEKINSLFETSGIGTDFLEMEDFGYNIP